MGAHQGVGHKFRDMVQAATHEPVGTLYTYAEIAKALKVSIQTVEIWVKRGRIPSPIYIGSTARFTLEMVTLILKGIKADHSYPVADSPRASAMKAGMFKKKQRELRAARTVNSGSTKKRRSVKQTTKPKGKRGES